MTHHFNLRLDGRTARLEDAQTGALFGEIMAGHLSMGELHFSRLPLSPLALERAIEWTEDRIQAAGLKIPAGAQLSTQDPDVHQLAQLAGMQDVPAELHVDAVEQLFSRLVLQAHGQSPTTQDVSDSARVFATVVLLREMLHHLRFEKIRVAPAALA